MRLDDPSSSGCVLYHGGFVVLPGKLGTVIVHVEDDDLDDARSGERRRACEHAEKCDVKLQSCMSSGSHKDNRRRSNFKFFYFY